MTKALVRILILLSLKFVEYDLVISIYLACTFVNTI